MDENPGFSIGGYYSHIWFERDGDCLTVRIGSNGDFPRDGDEAAEFHICDFTQIEKCVLFWGKELRRRGWVEDDPILDTHLVAQE